MTAAVAAAMALLTRGSATAAGRFSRCSRENLTQQKVYMYTFVSILFSVRGPGIESRHSITWPEPTGSTGPAGYYDKAGTETTPRSGYKVENSEKADVENKNLSCKGEEEWH